MLLSPRLIRLAYVSAARSRAARQALLRPDREAIDQLLDGLEASDDTVLLMDHEPVCDEYGMVQANGAMLRMVG